MEQVRPKPTARPAGQIPVTPTASHSREVLAEQYASTFEPQEGVEYGWVQPYALKMYEETAKLSEYLDMKAEKLVLFTSAASSVLVAAITGAVSRGAWPVGLFALPSLVCGLLAISRGLKAQQPVTQWRLPSIQEALQYAEFCETEERAVPAFAAKLHWTSIRQAEVNDRKAQCVADAHQWLQRALWLLLLPVLAGLAFVLYPHLKGIRFR